MTSFSDAIADLTDRHLAAKRHPPEEWVKAHLREIRTARKAGVAWDDNYALALKEMAAPLSFSAFFNLTADWDT